MECRARLTFLTDINSLNTRYGYQCPDTLKIPTQPKSIVLIGLIQPAVVTEFNFLQALL